MHKVECITKFTFDFVGGGGGYLIITGNLSLLVLGAVGIRLTKATSKMALPTPVLRPDELHIRISPH